MTTESSSREPFRIIAQVPALAAVYCGDHSSKQREDGIMNAPGNFLADIKEIRQRARRDLTDGAVTKN